MSHTYSLLLALSALVWAHTPVAGSPADLAGDWTSTKVDASGQYDARMVLEEGGEAQLEGSIAYSDEYAQSLDTTDIEGFSLFPDGLFVTFAGPGSWRADGDSLHIDAGEVSMLLNGLEPIPWVEDAGRRLANVLADALGLPVEGREGFEANTIAALMTQLDPDELTGLAVQSFELGKAWHLEGNELTLTDADGTSRWLREGAASAVQASTWGQLKAR